MGRLESPFLNQEIVARSSSSCAGAPAPADAPPWLGAELEEGEFHLNRLPRKAREQFDKGTGAWREAVKEAIQAGIKDPGTLADLMFFMHHPDRMKSGVGRSLSRTEPDFVKLRALWNLYCTIASGFLNPSSPPSSVFIPGNASRTRAYEDYVANPTTGLVTLLLNGRTTGGARPRVDETGAFDSMQKAVEALGTGDYLYLTTWQLKPSLVPLTAPGTSGMKNWGDLLVEKAKQGVTIRIIMSDFPPQALGFKSDVDGMKALVARLPVRERDNLKYLVSMHPAKMFDPRIPGPTPVATHHHKFMVLRKGKTHQAFCGGLDISPPRTPDGWAAAGFVWHDVHSRLDGLIVLDLEREFVLRWNREKGHTTAGKLPDWKAFEELTADGADATDRNERSNTHRVQMQRTVSTGGNVTDIKRDDIWQGYFRLVASARRFLFVENQYIREPVLADAIVVQAQANPELVVIIVVSKETDDPDNELTQHGRSLQHEFFRRLFAGIPPARRRVYAMFQRLVHSKILLVDDRALTIGSANANPRGFFMDSELNVTVDNAALVRDARHELWSHDLNVSKSTVAGWPVGAFIARWDEVAKANDANLKTPAKMVGEGVISYDPLTVKGKNWSPIIPDVLTEM